MSACHTTVRLVTRSVKKKFSGKPGVCQAQRHAVLGPLKKTDVHLLEDALARERIPRERERIIRCIQHLNHTKGSHHADMLRDSQAALNSARVWSEESESPAQNTQESCNSVTGTTKKPLTQSQCLDIKPDGNERVDRLNVKILHSRDLPSSFGLSLVQEAVTAPSALELRNIAAQFASAVAGESSVVDDESSVIDGESGSGVSKPDSPDVARRNTVREYAECDMLTTKDNKRQHSVGGKLLEGTAKKEQLLDTTPLFPDDPVEPPSISPMPGLVPVEYGQTGKSDHSQPALLSQAVLKNVVTPQNAATRIAALKLAATQTESPGGKLEAPSIAKYYPGVERSARLAKLLSCELTLADLLQSGRGTVENVISLIKSKSLQNKLEEALQVYDEAIELGFPLNDEKSFVALLQGAAIRADPAAARNIWLKMRSLLIPASVVSYTALIDAHVRADDFAAAFALTNKMRDEGLTPDVVTYTVIINRLVETEQYELAWRIFNESRSWHLIEPDTVLFTVLIKACANRDEPEKALNVYDDLVASGQRPTDITYTELIRALSGDPSFFQATFDFVEQMRAEEMPLLPSVYESMCRACATTGNVAALRRVLKDINGRVVVTADMTSSVIRTFAAAASLKKADKAASIKEAWAVIRAAVLAGMQVTSTLLNSVITLYSAVGLYEYAIEMLPVFSHFDCVPESTTYLALLEILRNKLKDTDRFFLLWDEISHHSTGVAITPQMCDLALHAAVDSASCFRVLSVLQFMYSKEIWPQAQTVALLQRKAHPDARAELTLILTALNRLQQMKTQAAARRDDARIDLLAETHKLGFYSRGDKPGTLTPEEEVRKEYFDMVEKASLVNGKKIPKHLWKQLQKKGGEYYAMHRDKPTPARPLRNTCPVK